MKVIPFFGLVFFWASSFIYGAIYNWNWSASVQYYSKGYSYHAPLFLIVASSFIVGLVWFAVWFGIARKEGYFRFRRPRYGKRHVNR